MIQWATLKARKAMFDSDRALLTLAVYSFSLGAGTLELIKWLGGVDVASMQSSPTFFHTESV